MSYDGDDLLLELRQPFRGMVYGTTSRGERVGRRWKGESRREARGWLEAVSQSMDMCVSAELTRSFSSSSRSQPWNCRNRRGRDHRRRLQVTMGSDRSPICSNGRAAHIKT